MTRIRFVMCWRAAPTKLSATRYLNTQPRMKITRAAGGIIRAAQGTRERKARESTENERVSWIKSVAIQVRAAKSEPLGGAIGLVAELNCEPTARTMPAKITLPASMMALESPAGGAAELPSRSETRASSR